MWRSAVFGAEGKKASPAIEPNVRPFPAPSSIVFGHVAAAPSSSGGSPSVPGPCPPSAMPGGQEPESLAHDSEKNFKRALSETDGRRILVRETEGVLLPYMDANFAV